MGKHRGNTGEEWPKRLDLSDPGISKILTDAFANLKENGNGILPFLRECYPGFSADDGPESLFRKIGLLDGKGELALDRGKIALRALCEARGQFENALGAFADNAEISPDEIALLEGPINDAVEAVRARVEEWKKEQAGARQAEQDEIRSMQIRIAKPGDNIEIGKSFLNGTLKIEIGEKGDTRMSFRADNVAFFTSPFADRRVPVETGLMVRSAKNILKKLSGKIEKGKSVTVDCVAKVVDLKVSQRREDKNDHDFCVDVVSVSPESLMAARAVDVGGARIPLMDLYKVEDLEGEKVKGGEGFRGFKELTPGMKLNGVVEFDLREDSRLVHFADGEVVPESGYVYTYKDPENNRLAPFNGKIMVSARNQDFPIVPLNRGKIGYNAEVELGGALTRSMMFFGDKHVSDGQRVLGFEARVVKVGEVADDRKQLDIAGKKLPGVLEIVYGRVGQVARVSFVPDRDSEHFYCVNGTDSYQRPVAFLVDEALEVGIGLRCLPEGFSDGRIGTVRVRCEANVGRLEHMTCWRKGFKGNFRVVSAVPVSIGEELPQKKFEKQKKLIRPGDPISGTLLVKRTAIDNIEVSFARDGATGAWEDRLECEDFMMPDSSTCLVPSNVAVEDREKWIAVLKDQVDIGATVKFATDARFCCGTQGDGGHDEKKKYFSVIVDKVGDIVDDGRNGGRLVDFDSGEIKKKDHFRGQVVIENERGSVEVCFRFGEGKGPYTGKKGDICSLFCWAYGSVKNGVNDSEVYTLPSEFRVFQGIFGKDLNAPYVPVAGEEVVYDGEVEFVELNISRDSSSPSIYLRRLGKCLNRDLNLPEGRNEVSRGSSLKGKLIVPENRSENPIKFVLDGAENYFFRGKYGEKIPLSREISVSNYYAVNVPAGEYECDVLLDENPWYRDGYQFSSRVMKIGEKIEEVSVPPQATEFSAKDFDTLARTLGGEKAHQGELNGKLVTGCVLKGRLNVKNTDGNFSMSFSLPWRGEGNGYKSVDAEGNDIELGGELYVANGDELLGTLPLGEHSGPGWTSYLGCDVMFCDPTSRYPGMCSVFVLRTFND